MSVSPKTRRWLIILSVPVILIIGVAVALKMYFTSERLKALVVPKLEEITGREVTLKDINFAILPTLGVELEGLTISNRKGFTEKPMLSLDRLLLDVRILALFKGNLEINTMLLERPVILLEINEMGAANYASEKTPDDVTGEKKPGEPGEERGLLLSNFEILNGSLEYINRKYDSATRIEDLYQQMRVEFVPARKEVRIESQTRMAGLSYGSVATPLVSGLRIVMNQSLVYQTEPDQLSIERGECVVQEMVLQMRGSVYDVSVRPVLDVVFEGEKINIADLLSLAPKEYMKKAEGLKGNGVARVKIMLSGAVDDTTDADVGGMISATNASIQYAQLPKPITNVNVVSDFTRTKTKQEFRLTQFSATLGNNPISATMTVTNFDDPSLRMDINASLKLDEVKDYYPLEPGTQMSGSLKANVNIAGKASNPSAIKASGTMEFIGVTIKMAGSKNPLQNLQGTVTFNNQIIEAKKISMTLGKSDLSVAFWMKNYLSMMTETGDKTGPRPQANISLASRHLYTIDIMPEDDRNGSKADSKKGEKKQKKPGVPLPNVDMDVTATVGTLTMEKFELTNVRGTMKITNGVINMQSFSSNVFDGSVITRGTLNLQDQARPMFDMTLDLNGLNAHTLLPKFTSFGQRLHGNLTMNLTMKGALDDTLGLIPQTLNGNGQAMLQNGKVMGVKVNQMIAGLLKLPDLEVINFKDWQNMFTITDGRFFIKDLKIAAFDADYNVNGSMGLDGTLEYTMALLLPEKTSARITVPGFAGEAVNLLKDESGRVRLDFAVGGTSDNPKVSLDTKALQRKAEDLAKKKVSEEAKKIEDQLKGKGKDLIKDLLKKKK